MSCSQVFLTYKRKRLTGTGPAQGNGCHNSLPTRPNGNSFTSLNLHDDVINGKTSEDKKSNAHFLGNDVHSERNLSLDSMGTSNNLTIDVFRLKSSFARKGSFKCDDDISCRSKTLSSENHASLAADDNNNTVCSGLVEETRSRAPLITFSRKYKRRETDRSDELRKLLLEDKSGSLVDRLSESPYCSTSSFEYQKGCSKGHETDLKSAGEVDDTCYSIEDKVTVIDSMPSHARTTPETEILILESERQHDGESTSDSVLNLAELVPDHSAQNVVHIRKDLPMDSLETSLGNIDDSTCGAVDAVTKLEEINACKREESRAISSDDEKAKIGASLPFLELSVAPTDSSGVLDCNVNMDTSSQNLSFYCRSHTTTALGALSFQEKSDLRNERHPLKMQTDTGAGVEYAFLKESSFTCTDNDKSTAVSMNFTCKPKCLQLFPEDKHHENFQMSTTQPYPTAFTVTEEGNTIQLVDKNKKKKRQSPPFLGLSLPTKRNSTGSASVNCSTTYPLLNLYGETREFFQDAVAQSSSNNLSSIFRHRELDSIVTRSGALNERYSFEDDLKSYATSWTEEELDFLWIGVRRHGVDNWNAMLKDSKLHFSKFRVGRDLAERWEVERSKLFKGIYSPQLKHSKAQGISSNLYNSFPCQTSGSRTEDLENETRLSLGDVYTCGEGNGSRRSWFKSPYLPNNLTEYLKGPFLYPTRDPFVDYRKGKYEWEPPNHSRGTCVPDYNPLITDSPTTFMARTGNLPHWIREAVCAHPCGLTEPNILSGVSLSSQPQELHATHPYFYSSGPRNGMYHQPSSRVQRFNCLTGMSHGEAEARKTSSHACRAENVIVINSDASSEETISDDHGVKP